MNNSKKIITGILLLAIFGAIYFLINRNRSGDVRGEQNTYKDPQGIFSFVHPYDFTVDVFPEANLTRLIKEGTTQENPVELSDGVIIILEPINLEGMSLDQFVSTQVQESIDASTLEIVHPKKEIMISEYAGFSYQETAVATFTYVYLQKDPQSSAALKITYVVSDPKQYGYQSQVDDILSSLKLLK